MLQPLPPRPDGVLAIMDLDDPKANLAPAARGTLADYLAIVTVERTRYRAVPRGVLHAELRKKKLASYQECFDDACQIELGKALAADRILAPGC